MPILDQNDDHGGQILYRIIKDNSPPDFVKSASSTDIYGPEEGLPPHTYADPIRRKFPCHTAASTWTSTAFYLDNKEKLPEKLASWIVSRIKAAASKFAITAEINKLVEAKAASEKKIDSPRDDDYAVVIKYADGSKERYYPLCNRAQVKEAAEYLFKYRDHMPYDERRAMAEKILDKAVKFGAHLGGLDEYLEKQAGIGVCAAVDIAEFIENRIKAIGRTDKPTEAQTKLAAIAEVCRKEPAKVKEAETLCKLASLIDSFDRMHGLHKEYSNLVPRIEDVFFAINKKTASQLITDNVSLTNGSIYKISDLEKVALEDLRGLMGDDFAEAASADGLFVTPEKLAELAKTLPRPDAQLIDRLFQDVGIEPMGKQAAASTTGLSMEDWAELAKTRTT